MQAFYNQLVAHPVTQNLSLDWLFRLTQANLSALTALRSDLAWVEWGTETH